MDDKRFQCPECGSEAVFLHTNEEGEDYIKCDECQWSEWGDFATVSAQMMQEEQAIIENWNKKSRWF